MRCHECGTEFFPAGAQNRNKTMKYCSKKCYYDYRNRVNGIRRGQTTGRCKMCKSEFKLNSPNHRYCSKECMIEFNNIDNRAEIPLAPPRKCKRCGKTHRDGNYFYCQPCHTLLTDAFDPYSEGMDGFNYEDIST